MSIIVLMGSLQEHEQRLNRHSEASLENAIQSKLNAKAWKLGEAGRKSQKNSKGGSKSQGEESQKEGKEKRSPALWHMQENKPSWKRLLAL